MGADAEASKLWIDLSICEESLGLEGLRIADLEHVEVCVDENLLVFISRQHGPSTTVIVVAIDYGTSSVAGSSAGLPLE